MRILFLINLLAAAVVILPMLTFSDRPLPFTLEQVIEGDRVAYDWRVRNSAPKLVAQKDEDIVIVNIDRASIQQEGSWPWRRDRIAALVKNLLGIYKARLVILPESFLAREDQTDRIIEELRSRFFYDNAILTALDQLGLDFNFDRHLVSEMDGRPVLIGFEFDQTDRRIGLLPVAEDVYAPEGGALISGNDMRPFTTNWTGYRGYVSSDEEFLYASLGAGFTNLVVDPDGTLRSYKIAAQYAGARYYSLPLIALRYFNDPGSPERITAETAGGVNFFAGDSIETLGAGDESAGISREGDMLLRYYSLGTGDESRFQYYSANKILASNQVDVDILGKVVIIGSDSEEINDFWRTPVNSRMPGAEIYATALRNLIDGTFTRPQNAWLVENVLLILMGVTLALLFSRLRVLLSLIFTVVLMYLVYLVNVQILWEGAGQAYRIVPFMILLLVMFIVNLTARFLVEFREKRKFEGVLNQYIPPELAREVNTSKKGFSMEGEIREMTILFSDVRGFTSISERFSAQELTKFMNRMLNTLSHQIHANRGTIDKYIGDAVMAFWNAPVDDPNHATNAVRGAIGMQVAMAKLSEELVARGYPELKMGVGINTGEACVGNMGSEIRLSYTVMGDSVNLASRLEGITKQYGVSVIVGQRTYELTKDDFIYRPVDAVRVKGKQQAVLIYEPIADARHAKESHKLLRQHSVEYWDSYREGRFEEAQRILKDYLARYEDGLMSVYLERVQRLLDSPPSDDWEPVTTFDTK